MSNAWMTWPEAKKAHAVDLVTRKPRCNSCPRVPDHAVKAPGDADLCGGCVSTLPGRSKRKKAAEGVQP